MSSASERAVVFECESEELVGIVHVLDPVVVDTGVLIIVGGPQYRAGSHRQFILLARFLAAQCIPVMRFDYRGMGDSSGELRGFEDISADINTAIDTFCREVPSLKKVVLWGLCDAASAALFYAPTDPRVTGLVLLNPWVHTEAGQAKTILKHYYSSRFFSKAFWGKLTSGKFNLAKSLHSLAQLSKAAQAKDEKNTCGITPLPQRMLAGLGGFEGRILIILSGNDLTADEFRELVKHSSEWQQVMQTKGVHVRQFAEADHTFSRGEWREQVERSTLAFIESLLHGYDEGLC